jgi:hypothetical protein
MREAGTYKLLPKPNGQQALVKGLARAMQRGADLDTLGLISTFSQILGSAQSILSARAIAVVA